MAPRTDAVELFDRVKIKEDAELVEFRGREGTVAYVGSAGVNILIEEFSDPVPLRWSEFEKIPWEDFGEEE